MRHLWGTKPGEQAANCPLTNTSSWAIDLEASYLNPDSPWSLAHAEAHEQVKTVFHAGIFQNVHVEYDSYKIFFWNSCCLCFLTATTKNEKHAITRLITRCSAVTVDSIGPCSWCSQCGILRWSTCTTHFVLDTVTILHFARLCSPFVLSETQNSTSSKATDNRWYTPLCRHRSP